THEGAGRAWERVDQVRGGRLPARQVVLTANHQNRGLDRAERARVDRQAVLWRVRGQVATGIALEHAFQQRAALLVGTPELHQWMPPPMRAEIFHRLLVGRGVVAEGWCIVSRAQRGWSVEYHRGKHSG